MSPRRARSGASPLSAGLPAGTRPREGNDILRRAAKEGVWGNHRAGNQPPRSAPPGFYPQAFHPGRLLGWGKAWMGGQLQRYSI